MYRIGVDVGGTNTDAVVMQGDKILSGVKSETTEDVMTGVFDAVEKALKEAGVDKDKVTAVMIGTTHFTNAVVERKHLARIAAVRLCLPEGQVLAVEARVMDTDTSGMLLALDLPPATRRKLNRASQRL